MSVALRGGVQGVWNPQNSAPTTGHGRAREPAYALREAAARALRWVEWSASSEQARWPVVGLWASFHATFHPTYQTTPVHSTEVYVE